MSATKDAVIDRRNAEDAIARTWAAYVRKAESATADEDEIRAAFDAYLAEIEADASTGAE